MKYGMSISQTDGCCGVSQVCNFSAALDDDDYWGNDMDITADGDTLEEVYPKLFNQLMDYDPKDSHEGRVFQIWFQKSLTYNGEFEDTYVAEPLRLLVEKIPNVVNLGEYVNYKSGNKIQGYQWEQPI